MAKKGSHALLALLAIPIIVATVVIIMLGGSAASSSATGCPSPSGLDVSATAGVDPTQMSIAQQIVAAVRAFPPTADHPHAAVIALATARQESGLRNLDYGDRDSLGVFQQRPSQGWGTPDQVMNPTHATTTFLRHLIRVPGWQTRPVTDVAAAVQHPAAAYRGLYQRWVPLATELTKQLWPAADTIATAPVTCTAGRTSGTGPNTLTRSSGPAGSTATKRAQSWVTARVPYSQGLYFTNQYGTYRQDCSGYVSMAWGLPTSLTTYSLPNAAHRISKDQLRSGDIILKPGHVVLFDHWANPDHTAYWAYEEQHPGTVAIHHVVPYPYWPGQGTFAPYRKN